MTYDGRRDGPVHSWFELSYSSYLVIPRTILQAMPVEWQERFVRCLNEARSAAAHLHVSDRYTVLLRDERGRFTEDPFASYRHSHVPNLELPGAATGVGLSHLDDRIDWGTVTIADGTGETVA